MLWHGFSLISRKSYQNVFLSNSTNQREKRKKLLAILKELDEKHQLLERSQHANDVNDIIHHLHSILEEYEKELPKEVANNIDSILKATDVGPDQLKGVLENARNGIQQAVNALPASGGVVSSSVIITVIAIAAVAGGGAFAYMTFYSPVEIQIINYGCSPIVMNQYSSINIPGLKFPDVPIPSGGQGVLTSPRIIMDIDASKGGSVSIGVMGMMIPIHIGGTVTNIQFDDSSILGESKSFNLGENQQHKLVISCK